MAKIQVYKFVNPGVASVKTPSVVAARQGILAQNRLGKTVEGVGNTVLDLDKITNLRLGIQQKADIAERRQKQRERDAEAEELTEKGLNNYFKKKGKQAEKFKPNSKLKNSFTKLFGWVGPALSPFVELATKIFALGIMKSFLEWTADEENLKKLETFLMKTDFVFRKIYGFGKWLIKDNIVEGIEQLFGDDSTFLGRIGGLGKLMTGIIGLKYLMNPFSIITDIIFLANILMGTSFFNKCGPRGRGPGRRVNPRNQGPFSRSRRTPTTSGGKSTGRFSPIREFIRNTKKKFGLIKDKVTTSGSTSPKGNIFTRLGKSIKNTFGFGKKPITITQSTPTTASTSWLGKIKNLFKPKSSVPITQGGQTPGFFSKPPVVTNTNITQGNFFTRNLARLKNIKPGSLASGASNITKGFIIGWLIQQVYGQLDAMEQRKLANQIANSDNPELALKNFIRQLEADERNVEENWRYFNFTRRLKFVTGFIDTKFTTNEEDSINNRNAVLDMLVEQGIFDPEAIANLKAQIGNEEFLEKDGAVKDKKKLKQAIKNYESLWKLDGYKFEYDPNTMYFVETVNGNYKLYLRDGNVLANPSNTNSEKLAKKKWWEFWKADGGKLPEYFIGGLFKAVKNVVSGVVNTVTNVAKTVWNGVSQVASNPLVSTVASFIPGANIIVPAINAINALGSGDIMGAAMNALGGISNFANINTVNAINQPTWMQNLRFSKFGQGVSNMYHGAVKAVANISSRVNGFFDMARNSTIGKIGMQVFNGNIGGAIGTIVGQMPGLSGGIENFGNWLKKNKLEGILGAVPGLGGLASKVPNILSIPGMESILGKPGEGFSALGAIGNIADKVGMKGVYQAIMSGVQSGNFIEGLPELAAEIGVDPRVLGVLDRGRDLLQNNQFNAEYAMQTAIEFLPVPLIVEKIVAAPTPVPINSGDTYLVAPSSTTNR